MKLLLTMTVLLAVLSPGFAQDAAKQAEMKNAALQTVNIGDISEFDKKDMLKKVPFAADKLVINTYFFSPGQVLRFHEHPSSDELFYIVEGSGQLTVGDNQVMVDSGSLVYGPANVPHGLVNSGNERIVMISVQSPKPVTMKYVENSSIKCPVCGQENIIPANAKEGDIVTCPRCRAKFKLSKGKDGKWAATQL